MASKTARVPFLRALAKRSFSAELLAKPASCAVTDIKVTPLPNQLVIASADCNNQGLVKVSVAIKAGSRYETPDNFGVSNIIRSSAGLSTKSASKFGIIRNLQQLGSVLTATSDRETIVYTLETTSNNLCDSLKYLKAVAIDGCFKPWELSDNTSRIQYELASIPPMAKLLDDLHRVAYRSGLGNSIFVKDYNIKNLGPETIQHYVNSNFLANRTAVAGVGVDHSTLRDFATELNLESGTGSTDSTKYGGGEIRHEANTKHTHVAFAVEASGLTKKEVFAYAVLRCAIGGSHPSVKWGKGAGPLAAAIANIEGPVAAQAFNAAHSDSGLFGITVSGTPDNIGPAVRATVKTLKSGVKDTDVARAKALLKAEILYSGEECSSLVADMANQSVLIGSARSPKILGEAVDQVTVTQVQEVLNRALEGKKSMASIGNLHNVPFLDELTKE